MKILALITLVIFSSTAIARPPRSKPLVEQWELNGSLYKKYFVPDLNAWFFLDDIPDGIKDHLRRGIYWEGGIGNLIATYTKQNTVAIDIGAHIGIHTIRMSRSVGPEGTVVAFEPQQKMFGELQKNLEINKCLNVYSHRIALGAMSQTIQLNPRDILNEGGTAVGSGGDTAQMIRLDDLNLTNISLIKMDVECYEHFVFEGAKNTILKNMPVIIFELLAGSDYLNCDEETREKFERVFMLLESWGYNVNLIFGADYIAIPINYKP